MKTRSFTIALMMAASTAIIAPAAVASESGSRTATVEYTDLDLSTAQDLERLDRRIDRAARQVCEYNTPDTGTRLRDRETTRCYTSTRQLLQQQSARLVSEARGRTLAIRQ